MEERKRTFDGTAIPGDMQMNMNQPKRLRPEEIVGGRDDPSKAISRLLLNRSQFSRIIGKGGQTIAQIRNNTGVLIKGSDIDDDNRLVSLSSFLTPSLTTGNNSWFSLTLGHSHWYFRSSSQCFRRNCGTTSSSCHRRVHCHGQQRYDACSSIHGSYRCDFTPRAQQGTPFPLQRH